MYNNDYRKMRRKRIYIKLLIFWISLIVLVGGGYLFYRAHMVKKRDRDRKCTLYQRGNTGHGNDG